MSIYAYTGLPGSGKSYNVVDKQILPALREGRTVVTNLPLNDAVVREAIPGCDLRYFDIDAVRQQPALLEEVVPAGAVWIADELWKLWPAGQKTDKVPDVWKSFLAEHRHKVGKDGRSTQIVFVTQDLAQISAFARQLVEQTFHHTKLNHIGANRSFQVVVYQGAVTGAVPPDSRKIVSSLGRYKEEVFRFYKSHTMSESGGAGDESNVDQRGNIWKRPGLWLMGALGLGCLAFGGTWIYGVTQDPAAAVGGSVAARPQPPLQSGIKQPAGAPVPVAVRRWRISGYLLGEGGGSRVLVTDGHVSAWYPLESYCRFERTGALACTLAGQKLSSIDLPL